MTTLDLIPSHVCTSCGERVRRAYGRCPECGEWGSVVLEGSERGRSAPAPRPRGGWGGSAEEADAKPGEDERGPRRLTDIEAATHPRVPTGIESFDEVLGGGPVLGGIVLVAGPPGKGKSTLMMQVLAALARAGVRCLLVSGEESEDKIAARAHRVGTAHQEIFAVYEQDLSAVLRSAEEFRPGAILVDSVQKLRDPNVTGRMGSRAQVTACAEQLCELANDPPYEPEIDEERVDGEIAQGMKPVLFLISQVNKEGEVAGPKCIEHLVDVVVYLEPSETRSKKYRVFRQEKNRFGGEDAVGLFKMTAGGLVDVGPVYADEDEEEEDGPGGKRARRSKRTSSRTQAPKKTPRDLPPNVTRLDPSKRRKKR